MKSYESARRGSQKPRVRIEPARSGTDGTDAAELVATYGFTLDPWQAMVLDAWLGTDERGDYVTTTAGLSVPRQNGKNAVVEAREFYGLLVNGEKILHTAHQVKTSKKAFHRIESLFTDDSHPELQAEVLRIRRTNGEEAIELRNGGRIEYSARTRGASRGFAGISLVVYDEAQELQDEQVEAIMSTLAASDTGQRQLIYTGTPPGPNCPGNVFKRVRAAALDFPGEHTAWHEWGVQAKSIDDIDTSDRSLWYECNPALGIRLDEDFTAEEQQTMSDDGFARERLGWWSPTSGVMRYAMQEWQWDELATDEPPEDGKLAYGVRFSADGSEVSLAVALKHEDGVHVEQVRRENASAGLTWLADFIAERKDKACICVIDGKSGVQALVDRLERMPKGYIHVASAADATSAATTLVDMVNESRLSWYAPQSDLRDSAVTSVRRNIGNSGSWGFGGENPTPVTAASLAVWGVMTARRNPRRKGLVG